MCSRRETVGLDQARAHQPPYDHPVHYVDHLVQGVFLADILAGGELRDAAVQVLGTHPAASADETALELSTIKTRCPSCEHRSASGTPRASARPHHAPGRSSSRYAFRFVGRTEAHRPFGFVAEPSGTRLGDRFSLTFATTVCLLCYLPGFQAGRSEDNPNGYCPTITSLGTRWSA